MKLNTSTAVILLTAAFSNACLLPGESLAVGEVEKSVMRRQNNNNHGHAIGTGDRFEGGAKFPRGLGTQPPGTKLGAILSLKEIESAFKGLVKEYGFQTFTAPIKTFENRTVYGGRLGTKADCRNRYAIYLQAGLHARERGSSDNLLYFIGDLLYARKHNIGLTYGGRSFTPHQVKLALSTGIVFVPALNPDGIAYDQETNSCWRKNRNTRDANADPLSVGVDLNRNFDFLWDFPKLFSPTIAAASLNPAAQNYRGSAAFSEAESQISKWVVDTHRNVRYYVDIHSHAGSIIFGPGSDELQTDDRHQNFLNPAYDDLRGEIPNTARGAYAEYISNEDWALRTFVGTRIATAADGATGRHYEVLAGAYLYPTSGGSNDYFSTRNTANSTYNRVHGFTIEFGFANNAASCTFYPTEEQYRLSLLETGAAFMELLLAARDAGVGAGAGDC